MSNNQLINRFNFLVEETLSMLYLYMQFLELLLRQVCGLPATKQQLVKWTVSPEEKEKILKYLSEAPTIRNPLNDEAFYNALSTTVPPS